MSDPKSPPSSEPRNLVLCLDGTNDFAAQNPTHVFRLFRTLERSESQVVYYDGGVGTLKDAKSLNPVVRWFGQTLDGAAGTSIADNFMEAYRFLMANYRDGDRIFLIGFSRGAYTARALAGALRHFGLLDEQHDNVVPYVWQMYSDPPEDGGAVEAAADAGKGDPKTKIGEYVRNANRIKGAFGRSVRVHFLGAWDTVSSYGLIRLKTLPQTSKLSCVDTVRHAVSIDERRNMFPENLCDPKHKDLKECWFAGVHRDVGGGGAKDRLGLGAFSLAWMVGEAVGAGLKIDPKKKAKLTEILPDAAGKDNSSLLPLVFFACLGLVPMKWWNDSRGRMTWKWLNLWHVRQIPTGATAHVSVEERMSRTPYRPKNVERAGVVFDG